MVVRIGDPAEVSPAPGNTFTNNMTASVVIFGQEGGSGPHAGDNRGPRQGSCAAIPIRLAASTSRTS